MSSQGTSPNPAPVVPPSALTGSSPNSSTTPSSADLMHQKSRDEAVEDGKKISYYEMMVNAYMTSAMEVDKSLLTLASGAIAFSLGLITPLKGSDLMMFFYFSSIVLFVITIFCALLALKLNLIHIRAIVRNEVWNSVWMRRCDIAAIWTFSIGIFLLSIVGATSVLSKEKEQGVTMSEKSVETQLVEIRKSVDRIEALSAESFHNVELLRARIDVAGLTPGAAPTSTPPPAQQTQGTAADLAPQTDKK